ncbi:MAG: hypothetical protein NTX51_07380 [Verrucomicrobia bacterium]|nr:hypothetical protein [Verrucomicrobiota bacterium]
MEVPIEGKYKCKLNGQLVIYEASTGSLCGAVPCVILESATPVYEGFTFKHTLVLVKADGTIQTKTTDTLKTVFNWDGVDPFWLMDNSVDGGPMRSVEFEIVGGPETGDKGGQYFKSQWLNPLGGGMRTPMAADRRSVLAKYGTKFQALANVGGQKAEGRGQNAPARVPPVPSGGQGTARPTTPPPGTVTATMEEAWAALNATETGKPAAAIEKTWFDTIARVFPNKSNADLKPQEWGKLKAEFEDQIPM